MESASQNNAWMESYLNAWLSGGLSNEYTSKSSTEAVQNEDADLYSQYYLHQIMSSTEDSLVSAWKKSQAFRETGSHKDARLQYLSWRVWGMHRRRGATAAAAPSSATDDFPDLEAFDSTTMSASPSAAYLSQLEESKSGGGLASIAPFAGGLVGRPDHLAAIGTGSGLSRTVSGDGTSPGSVRGDGHGGVNPFAGRVDKLYLVLISLHGLVRGQNMELGKDADTGGQVKYVVELAKNLAQHPMVHRVDLLTRLIQAPGVAEDYGQEEECILKTDGDYGGAYICRLPAGDPKVYIPKEDLWPHVREFADHGLAHVRNMRTKMMVGEPCELYTVHGHYADAGEVAALMSHTLGVEMVLTGHSLGRNKLDHLLKGGTVSRAEMEETYSISRRIEGEERALDAASLVVTSTQQEIDLQWCLYDGYDKDRAKAMRYKSVGRHMPEMTVIPPGLDFSSLKVTLPSDPQQLFIDYDNSMMDRAKTLHSHVSAGNLAGMAAGGAGDDPAAPADLDDLEDEAEEEPPSQTMSKSVFADVGKGLATTKSASSRSMGKLQRQTSGASATDLTRALPSDTEEPEIWHQCARFLRNPRKPVVLAMSRPDAKKNITTLVKAFGENPALREIANLVLIMGNRDNIDDLAKGSQTVLQTVLKLIDTYDLYGSVAYPKAHKQSDISDIYHLSARSRGVFTNIALQEPFGLTLIEAAVHGVPIVATKHGGPVDIIRTLKCGTLVEPTNASEVSAAVLDIIRDTAKWDTMSANGCERILAYSWPSHCIKYLEAINAGKQRSQRHNKSSSLVFDSGTGGSGQHTTKAEAIEALRRDIGDVSVSSLAGNRQASLPMSVLGADLVDRMSASMASAHSATTHDDLLAVAGRALAAVSRETRLATKTRMAFAVLDNSSDVTHLIAILTATLKPADATLGVGVLTVLTFLELQEALRAGGFDIARLDFVVCNAGAYIMCVHADGDHWVSDEAWEVKAALFWDKQLVQRTLTRMAVVQTRSAKEGELVRGIEGVDSDGNGPLHLLFDFDPASGAPLAKLDNATLIDRVRKRVRTNGIRCNLTLQLVPTEGGQLRSILHATPMRASRPLAVRHLAATYGLDLTKSTFLCLPTSVSKGAAGHTLGALCSDTNTLVQGAQRVVVVRPGRDVRITAEDAPDAARGEAAFERLKVNLIPYSASRVIIQEKDDSLDDLLASC